MSAQPQKADWPQWFEALRLRAQAAFEAVPPPRADDLKYRFAAPDDSEPPEWADSRAAAAPEPSEAQIAQALARANCVRQPVARLVFLNGRPIAHDPLPPDWAQHGAKFLPLSRGVKECPELVAPLLYQSVQNLGSDRALYWHRSAAPEGAFLRVPKGAVIEKPLAVLHFTCGERAASRPHALVLLEEGAAANIVEIFISLDDAEAFVGAETEVFAGAGSRLKRTCIQYLNTKTRANRKESALLGANAAYDALSLPLGARADRLECAVRLAGAGAHARLFSAGVAGAGQTLDQRTLQDHLAPDTASDLLFKNAVFSGAKTVFAGMIDVKPKAQGTGAYQANRNLLMADDARAYSLPGLEIGANDVACSHGATASPVDDDALFYMRARGIPEAEARALLAEGFLADALDCANFADVRELCAAMLATKLESLR